MICDASILGPLFLPESGSSRVEAFLKHQGMESLISDFALGEFASTVSIKLRRHDITPAHAERVLIDFNVWISKQSRRIVTEPRDVEMATQLVRRFDLALRMPDALYIAQALRLSVPLATLDNRQAIAGREVGIHILEP
jgi:predicted nucleic acid-binding protein